MQKRIRDYGIVIGDMLTGPHNRITDVPGVSVGHVTLNDERMKTGVTAILPHKGNVFKEKVMAASHVINGFGKTTGTVQVEELGTIETPIILTNTLSVGTASEALVRYMLEQNEEIGITTGTVNPIVCECNDMMLNDIRGLHVTAEHVLDALSHASDDFLEGAVGAGTGMACYGLKGGIGSASRTVEAKAGTHTVGVLVLSNFGRKKDFILAGIPAGKMIAEYEAVQMDDEKDKGSIIIVIATDAPLSERQLKRVSKRAGIGLTRTGSYMGNGSGDIVIAFTTANKILHDEQDSIVSLKMWNENEIDRLFRAVGEATEEAILNSMVCAEMTTGRNGFTLHSLKEYMHLFTK